MSSVQDRNSYHSESHSEAQPSSSNKKHRNGALSKNREEAKMIGQWRIGRTIGKGSSGRVKIAKHSVTGKYAAIKIVPKGLIVNSRMSMSEAGVRSDKILLGIEREIVIMKLIDHPNVLNLYDVWETSGELFLIMEYVPGGELFDYLVKRGRLPESEALHYFQQIIHAVDYCHRFNICHRDLKPENLLLDKDKNIKVADFGMAAWQAGERMLETSCGSPHYASPEIVAGKAYHGSASDIWSCGIILFALIAGRLPFDDDNIRVLLMKVKTGVFEMPKEVKGPVRDLLYKMLEKNPEKRITMAGILVHPFFTSSPSQGNTGRPQVLPPSLDEVESPVADAADIDPDIMGNLKTLWHGASDDEIVSALLGKEKTWEKAIYHLLIKYRNKHLENYNAEDESIRPKSSEPQRAERNALQPSSHSKNAANQVPSGGETERPQAPTPTKAQYRGTMGPTVQERLEKLNLRPTPQGPRPPMSPRNTNSANSIRPALAILTPSTPRFVQEPVTIHTAPATSAPPIVDDESQDFFKEVARQLDTLGEEDYSKSRSPVLEVPRHELGESSRFADAEDDCSDIFTPYTPTVDGDAFSVHSIVLGPIVPIDGHYAPGSAILSDNRRTSMRSGGSTSRPQSGFWSEIPPTPVTAESKAPLETLGPVIAPPASSPALPRDASYVYVELDDKAKSYAWSDGRSTRGASSINSRWSEATKSGKKAFSTRPVTVGSRQAPGDTMDGAKRSWFQNLFLFKPTPYTLWSVENVSITARIIQQQLASLGVRIAVENTRDQSTLRCKLSPSSKTQDRTLSKAIYFKVEIMHALAPSAYATGASFTLIKGAQSNFKVMCNALRQNYRLDRIEQA